MKLCSDELLCESYRLQDSKLSDFLKNLSLGIQVAEGDWQEITVQCMIFVYIY